MHDRVEAPFCPFRNVEFQPNCLFPYGYLKRGLNQDSAVFRVLPQGAGDAC